MKQVPGFVKLPKSVLNAEWANNPYMVTVFWHLLALANHEAKEWGNGSGLIIPRGGAITSYRSLADSCGITMSNARTAIRKLCAQGFAQVIAHPERTPRAHPRAHQYTIITICNFDNYSGKSNAPRTPPRTPQNETGAQQDAHPRALPKEISIYKEEIYKEVFGEDCSLLSVVEEWIAYKRESGKPYKSRKGLTQFCNLLKEYSGGDLEKARQIVAKSMTANWASIYPANYPPKVRAERDNPRLMINNNLEDFETTL